MLAGCDFPLVRDRFWSTGEDTAPGTSCSSAPSSPLKSTAIGRPGLRVLDLGTLPRVESPPTELRARKDKLAYFERQCSPVGHGLFVGAECVARNRESLREAGITHVINCVGFLYPAYFSPELEYRTLYLQDTPAEDITCIMYDVFDFIQAAVGHGADPAGRVLLHCSQGVSRSVSLTIAYLMWREGRPYEEVFASVKAARGIANPNIGFVCQLLQWQKRRTTGPGAGRLYRLAPQSPAAPQYLVPRSAKILGSAGLDPRGSFVLHTSTALFLWLGKACPEGFAAAATTFAAQLERYEAAPAPALLQRDGKESEEFWTALKAMLSSSTSEDGPEASGSWRAAAVCEMPAYDKDYELFARSQTARSSSADDSDASPRSARKTPRDERSEEDPSPNERQRKHARGTPPTVPRDAASADGRAQSSANGAVAAAASPRRHASRLPPVPPLDMTRRGDPSVNSRSRVPRINLSPVATVVSDD
ncbi:hypothetical protein ACKKBF_B19820 [Auxenochlorella protothecoides x Auxenochlorella symbiontica]